MSCLRTPAIPARVAIGVSLLLAVACARAPRTLMLSSGTLAAEVGARDTMPALPPTLAPRETETAVTAADLMTRLYQFADDSMLGRRAGTEGNYRATRWLAAQAERIGLVPAGEAGGWFQTVPIVGRQLDPASTLVVGGARVAIARDVIALPNDPGLPFGPTFEGRNVPIVYAGRIGEEPLLLEPERTRGKIVVLAAARDGRGRATWEREHQVGVSQFPQAAAVVIAALEIAPGEVAGMLDGTFLEPEIATTNAGRPLGMLVRRAEVERWFGRSLRRLRPGTTAPARATGRVALVGKPTGWAARNVVALLPGRDPALRGQVVALGAHSDHIGMAPPADHDSLLVHAALFRPEGAESPEPGALDVEERALLRAMLDSVRRVRPARIDSVFNGADDDGTGSVTLLEIAEALATPESRPRRSILFVWHTGEELGLYGSRWYTEHPTVPRDSIVAQLNVDMIGRMETGSAGHDVAVIGARRLSPDLGDLLERVNGRGGQRLRFERRYDADGEPHQFYCRSDHYMYARFGIPIAFFFTGVHPAYHQQTDEARYVNYDGVARIASYLADAAKALGDADARPEVKKKPEAGEGCRQ